MKRHFAALAALVVFLPALAGASTWNIDPDHTNVGFQVRHLMISNVKGVFGKVEGVITLDDNDLTKSKVEVSIDTSSVNTGNNKRDDHLRSPDFLDSAKFPSMKFVSKKVIKQGDHYQIVGDLTIRGVTKETVLNVDSYSPEAKDPWGNTRRGATATAKINRQDFGLTWNKALETGGVLVGDEVAINLEVEAIKTK